MKFKKFELFILIGSIIAASAAQGVVVTGSGFSIEGGVNFIAGSQSTTSVNLSSAGEMFEIMPMSGGGLKLGLGFQAAIFFPLSQFLVSVTPSSGFNIAPIWITIAGANFSPSSIVKITRSGQTDIIGSNTTVVSSGEIRCALDITGAQVGAWTVSVDDGGANLGTLADAFEVKIYPHDPGLSLNSPNPFDPARETTTIMYKLTKDTGITVAIFSTTAEILYKRSYPPGVNGGRLGDNSITWDGTTTLGELASNGVYLVHVIEQSSGKTLARGKIAVIRR